MSNLDKQISEDFAKKILKALYKLDQPIGKLDSVLSKIENQEIKGVVKDAIGEIMFITFTQLTVPIYRCHPQLENEVEER